MGIISIVFFILIAAVSISVYVPIIIQKKSNGVYNKAPYTTSKDAIKLHKKLIVADMHADSLLLNRNLLMKGTIGHIDIPRLIEGNVAIQAFTVVTKAPRKLNINKNDDSTDNITPLVIIQRWPIRTWFSLKERAIYQGKKLHKIERKSNGKFIILKNSDDIDKYLEIREKNFNITAGFLGLEGVHALEGKISNVDVLFNYGFRMMGLTHFFDNDAAGSLHGINKNGLTQFGREVVKRINDLNIIVDLAHASDRVFEEVIELIDGPVVVSHTGVKGIIDNNLNLSDEKIKLIAEKKGLIGIGFFERAIGGRDVGAVVRSIKYVADLVGVEYVSIGSDFDGYIKACVDSSGMVKITEELLVQGFSYEQIRLIMGENVLRVLRSSFPK